MALQIHQIRQQFTIFQQKEQPIIYLDTAATAQKPQAVLSAMRTFDETSTANVHRGMHILASNATDAFEDARSTVQRFINAQHAHEIIWTKNATEAFNLVAHSWAEANLQQGDTILVSLLEHHSNSVPWLQLQERKGLNVQWIGLTDNGQIDLDHYQQLLNEYTVKLVAITAQSNVTGTTPPIQQITRMAHTANAHVMIDAAQYAAHHAIDVQEWECDFLAFSGHKLYGPSGIGVLYAQHAHQKTMLPFLGGGGMIHEVHRDGFTPAEPPHCFEAGTPPLTQAIGLAAAINWLTDIGWQDIEQHEQELAQHAYNKLQSISNIYILQPSTCNLQPVTFSFTIPGAHPHDLTDLLGQRGICLRAGHHCTQPLHDHLGITASTRLSLGIYNTKEDIDTAVRGIEEVMDVLL